MEKNFKKIYQTLKSFFHWWGAQLLEMIPEQILSYFEDDKSKNILTLEKNQVRVVSFNDDERIEKKFSGSFDQLLEDKEFQNYLKQNLSGLVSIELCDDFILERTVNFPKVVENNINDIVTLESKKIFPLHSDKIYFDSHIKSYEKEHDFIDVEIGLIKKSLVDEIRATLGICDLLISEVSSLKDKGKYNFVNLGQKYKSDDQRMTLVFAASALVLGIICYVSIFSFYSSRADFLNENLRELAERAREINEIGQQIELYELKAKLHYEKQNEIRFDQVLSALTEVFPNDSWLFEYSQNGNMISISGLSHDTSVLITELNKNKWFTNISNRLSTQKNEEGQDIERFNITLELVGDNSD